MDVRLLSTSQCLQAAEGFETPGPLCASLLPVWGPAFKQRGGFEYLVLGSFEASSLTGFLPFAIREGPFGPVIHSTPYVAYGGPVAREAQVAAGLVEALLELAKQRGSLTVTVCLPPFYPAPLAQACRETLGPEHVRENFFQYSLLDQHPLERLSTKRRGAFNSEIRRALNAGVEFDWSPDRPALETWLDIYEARYAEIGAKPYPRDFYTSSWDDPSGRGRLRLVVARREGRIIGGTLFLSGQGVMDYFSTAFESACLHLYPGTALLDEAFRRFMAEGYTHFNWQSSPGRGGVFQYKARWGALEGVHHYLTRVTGDVRPLLERPVDQVAAAYAGCYVLPFSLWPPSVQEHTP